MHVGQRIFERCIGGVLKQKTRVLVTNQLQYLAQADRIYLVQDGAVRPVTLQSPEMQEMLDHHRGNNAVTQEAAEDAGESNRPRPDEEQEKPQAETVPRLAPQQSDPFSPPRLSLMSASSNAADRAGRADGDASHATRRSSTASGASMASRASAKPPPASAKPAGKLTEEEDRVEGGITWGTYKKYLSPFGGLWWLVTNVSVTILLHVFEKGSQLWLGLWAEGRIFPGMPPYVYLLVYGALIVLSAVCVALREVQFALGSARPMWTLHENALRHVIAAPMSYFDTTPSGRIINRFTGVVSCSVML